MSDSERARLLPDEAAERPQTTQADAIESTPLLANTSDSPRYHGADADAQLQEDAASIRSARSAASTRSDKNARIRWPSIIGMVFLGLITIGIILGAFFAPAAVEEYTKEAAVLEPTNLSLESITADGVRARIQANFRLDGARVKNEHVRRVGRWLTWVVRELGTEETKVKVFLPEYDNLQLGSAAVPPLTLTIVDGQNTAIDFIAELIPGDAEGIRMITNEWLSGKLDWLRIRGNADITVKSGIVPLGTHFVSESLTLEAKKLPQVPEYNITRLNFKDIGIPGRGSDGMAVEAAVTAYNKYPVSVNIPSLGFDIFMPNCEPSGPQIRVADAFTRPLAVKPKSNVELNVDGVIREIPKKLTQTCPDSNSSPLDMFLRQYMKGDGAVLSVRGKREASEGTPDWLREILASVTVPVTFPGRTFDNLIRNFSLTDVHFSLPPGDGDPTVSGTAVVMAALPAEMNFGLNVTAVKATADVFYRGAKMGELDLNKWQKANSTSVMQHKEKRLKIESRIKDAPLKVTDGDVFADVIQTLLFGGRGVQLTIKALVDIEVETVLGKLKLKGVPAEGIVPIKPLPKGSMGSLNPQISHLRILDTTYSSVTLEARVNVTNPTNYTASIPSANLRIACNGSVVGSVTAKHLHLTTGRNTNLLVSATWNPSHAGDAAAEIGRNLVSQYLSGFNTTISVKTHRGSIPGQPLLGDALRHLSLNLTIPRLRLPTDPNDDPDDNKEARKGHFIQDATMHVLSSQATFTLVSPLTENTLYIDSVNATALYNHTEPIGRIEYEYPIAAPPGRSMTPRMPVEWSLGSIGYDKLRKALGGTLKLDARAVVHVRVGNWRERLWYVGRGIGAHVRV